MPLPGGQRMGIGDHEKLDREFPLYDALYVACAAGGQCPHPPLASDFKGSDAVEQVPVSDQGRDVC